MRKSIRRFAELVARTWDLQGPIYKFGSYQVEGQEKMLDLRPLFPGKEYIGCDMREGPGVDKVLNLHAIGLPDNSVTTVLSFDTLEHVEDPRLALQEIHRGYNPAAWLLSPPSWTLRRSNRSVQPRRAKFNCIPP